MLIPQECYKPTFQIDGPIMQKAAIPIAHVRETQKSFGTKHHDERGHKKKRRFRFLLDDEADISEEAMQSESNAPVFTDFLQALNETYA